MELVADQVGRAAAGELSVAGTPARRSARTGRPVTRRSGPLEAFAAQHVTVVSDTDSIPAATGSPRSAARVQGASAPRGSNLKPHPLVHARANTLRDLMFGGKCPCIRVKHGSHAGSSPRVPRLLPHSSCPAAAGIERSACSARQTGAGLRAEPRTLGQTANTAVISFFIATPPGLRNHTGSQRRCPPSAQPPGSGTACRRPLRRR